MLATPTLSLTGIVSNASMSATASNSVWTYTWTVSTTVTSSTATVSGIFLSGNTYSGTESITFSIDNSAPTVTLNTNDPDKIVKNGDEVTISAIFSEVLSIAPTISLSGITTNTTMSSGNSVILKPNNQWQSSTGSFKILVEIVGLILFRR